MAKAGKAFGGYAGEEESAPRGGKQNQNDVPATERMCLAHGCPLLGTISLSVSHSHSAEWFCRYHSGRPASEWVAITRKLNAGETPGKLNEAEREDREERLAIQAESGGGGVKLAEAIAKMLGARRPAA